MATPSFVLAYTKTKAVPPARAAEFEKPFPTLNAALAFCVQLIALGGEALYIVKTIRGAEESVLEGDDLARAVKGAGKPRKAA